MVDGVRIAVLPVEHITGQNCVEGFHGSNENIATWRSWNLSNTTTYDMNAINNLSPLGSLFP
jgi:hypothetical protein